MLESYSYRLSSDIYPQRLFFCCCFVVNFVIHWNEKALGSHVFPIPIHPPTSLPTRSLQRLLRIPWNTRRSNQSILKEINPEYLLEGLILTLKLQYFGHLMQRADSLEKTLMLGKIENRRRRVRQKMRWLDIISNATNMSVSKLGGIVKDREVWCTEVHRVSKNWTWLSNWIRKATIYFFVFANYYKVGMRKYYWPHSNLFLKNLKKTNLMPDKWSKIKHIHSRNEINQALWYLLRYTKYWERFSFWDIIFGSMINDNINKQV